MVRARKNPPDGRANNGGARQGNPGKPHPNRSDLRAQKIAVPPSAEYGQGERLRAAQQAVPLAGAPAAATPAAAAGAAPAQAPPPGPMAGEQGDLLRPTERPGEPVTAGVPFGPGPMGTQPAPDPVLAQLQAYYSVFPTQDLADLIEDLMMQNGFR